MRALLRPVLALLLVVVAPSLAFAQASITGQVKDSSGAILPGVSVEATSPALIEKVRSAVTDGNGQYRIEALRPGTYVVTFSLSGFSTVKREGIELTGSFAATVNVDLRVGAVSETITVTGESPVVDIVNAKQQSTVTNEMISAIPTARLYHSLVTLVPGVTVSGSQDVGGLAGPVTVTFAMRGGPGNEGRLTVDGLSLGASLNGTGVSYTVADVGNAQEVVFTTAGGLGESEVGGPAMNLVPRQGGNNFSGSFFANWANDSFQTSNYTEAIQAAGLRAPNLMTKIWDVNGAIGGPVRQDKLWFFTAVRSQGNRKLVAGMFNNQNAGDVNAWTYVATNTQATDDGTWKNVNGRLTWQASTRNKFNFFWDEQRLCTSCSGGGSATTAPEARGNNHAAPRVQQVTWSAPATSRLLLEAGLGGNRIDQVRDPGQPGEQSRADTRDGAVHGRLRGERRHCRVAIPGEQLLRGRQRRHQLAGRGELRDRPEQLEIRLSGPVHRESFSELDSERYLDELSIQQRHPESAHTDSRPCVGEYPSADHVALCAGPVDPSQPHAVGRHSLRSHGELLPRAAGRSQSVHSRADRVPRTGRHVVL